MDADGAWGGKTGSADKAKTAMQQHYGTERGRRIYAAKTVQRKTAQSGIQGALRGIRRTTK